MCNFLSAIVTRTGEVYTSEHTDSHEDLIDWLGLKDNGGQNFVRVEMLPEGHDYAAVEKYALRVDQGEVPAWWAEHKERAAAELKSRIRRMIVSEDRKILLGGCWIVTSKAKIDRVVNARIVAMVEESNVGVMWGSSNVGEMWGSSKVGEMWGSSKVGEMWGSSNVGVMWGSSNVGVMWESSKVANDKRKKEAKE